MLRKLFVWLSTRAYKSGMSKMYGVYQIPIADTKVRDNTKHSSGIQHKQHNTKPNTKGRDGKWL